MTPPTPGTQAAPSAVPDDDEATLVRLVDELTAALRRGEHPDVEAVAATHPRLGGELRSLWDTIRIAELLSAAGGEGSPAELVAADGAPTAGPPPAASAVAFGDYVLLEELGRGGMGVVHLAREAARDRVVAIKRLIRGPGASTLDLERFRAESSAAAHLAHPHIVPVFGVGEHDGQPFFTMQYVEGTTLSRRLAEGPMTGLEAARLLVPICRAVHYAHERGVLHRDLKPSNVLIDRAGHPYVGDFGLARRMDLGGEPSLTPSGALVGTPSYMPPEQARGSARRGPLGPSCDVYSLGAILYQMLTGRPPFQGAGPVETMLLVLEQDPVPPRVLNPRVNPDLEMIALRCLQKQPEMRYPSAAALADDLEAFLRDEPVAARSTSLRALAARLMGESHHAPILENWGQLWIYHSIALIVFFGLTNAMHLSGVTARWPYVLLFTAGLGAWAAIFWAMRRRGGPISFVERQLAHVWGSGIVAINLVFLVEALLEMPVLSLFPMVAVTNSILFMVKAGILSGFYYYQAAALILSIFPIVCFPRFGPLIFGVVAAACFLVTGLKYRRRRIGVSVHGDGSRSIREGEAPAEPPHGSAGASPSP
ncbi:Serine/threonine-protein kinase PknB [Aquisphaera giovannonii]|uniref:Serine/threonine-protein kinase PknB n=1 Tax=Aquisphaera giovannonii TaxID=406548 RepID=A0A5B9WAW8_9BACT|nr:serine/threonine-protein kinase [Aquisphaera giovannonii]QEH37808.1 Serine/threonine-protein kinase PknB [Aquisphaera giovannonii]